MIEKVITIETIPMVEFTGVENKNIAVLSRAFPKSKIVARGTEIKIIGTTQEVRKINGILKLLFAHIERYGNINEENILDYLEMEKVDSEGKNSDTSVILYGNKGLVIKAKSANQLRLVDTILNNDITFAVGPAGTGKTYIAVALAVKALKNRQVKKIIITRPAVEAGESLGFLPGDLKEKIDPYLRPIYDALEDMIPAEKLNYYKENQVIEIAPLAYMRGRTLNNAYTILDEAQNTTPMQIKMFLTRLGINSKMIITGDVTQVDLPDRQKSGLIDAVETLKGVDGIGFIKTEGKDVVRHRIVKKVIEAYEKKSSKK